MTADEAQARLMSAVRADTGNNEARLTILGHVVVDLARDLEVQYAAQAETIERLEQEFARMNEREDQHLDTHIRLREVADKLADRVNDLDEFSGIGGPLEARVKALEAKDRQREHETCDLSGRLGNVERKVFPATFEELAEEAQG